MIPIHVNSLSGAEMETARILVIDDDRRIPDSVAEHLGREIGEVLGETAPEEGIRLARQLKPDLILLDINMPRMDGLKVCRHLKETAITRDIPVVFLTVDRNVQHLAKALECGGVDYILKPFHAIELQARVRSALRTKQMFDLLRNQARIDALTGLKNRAGLEESLRAAAAAFDRTGQPAALLLFDLDHFKKINDQHGHGLGDDVLRRVGNMMQRCCRPYDTACRFGGDEFGLVLGQTDDHGAERAARRLLEAIGYLRVPTNSTPIQVSCSAGLVSTSTLRDRFEPAEMVKAADQALYTAKELGRGRLVVASGIDEFD